jgi:hypothetical protein
MFKSEFALSVNFFRLEKLTIGFAQVKIDYSQKLLKLRNSASVVFKVSRQACSL